MAKGSGRAGRPGGKPRRPARAPVRQPARAPVRQPARPPASAGLRPVQRGRPVAAPVPGVAVAAVVLLLATPAVIVPSALDRFVFGKLLLAAVGIALAFGAPPAGRLPRGVRLATGAAALTLFVAAVTSDAPFTAVFGRAPRSEGIFVLATYLLAAISGARLLGPGRGRRAVDAAWRTAAVVALIVAFLAVLEAAGLRPLSSDLSRPGSLLGNASDEGGFAVLYGGVLAAPALRRRDPLLLLGVAAAALTVALSASRGALIGAAVVLVVLAAAQRRARRPVLVAAAALAVVVLALPYTRDRVLGISPLAGHTASGRLQLWEQSVSLFAHHWFLGVGPSQFENAIVREHDFTWQHTIGPENPPGSPHNVVLQILAAGGIVLLIAVGFLAWFAVRAAVRAIQDPSDGWSLGAVAGLAGFVATLQFNLTSPGTVLPACVLGGSLLAAAAPAARSVADRWIAAGVVGVGAVLAVLFLLASIADIYLRLGRVDLAHRDLAGADHRFATARTLRFWDADVSGAVFHDYVARVNSGDKAAVPYAEKWSGRTGHIQGDEQIAQNQAALLEHTGNLPAAAALLDRRLRLDPDDPQLLVLRGVVYAEQNDNAGAQRTLEHALRVDPKNASAWQDLAVVYQRLGRTADAATARANAARYAAK